MVLIQHALNAASALEIVHGNLSVKNWDLVLNGLDVKYLRKGRIKSEIEYKG